MALNATVYRCSLQVSDLDRAYYRTHALTVARHPSETEERMMVRILAFALNADQRLVFTRGLCRDDEPALWRRSLSDTPELWIELGQPDARHIRRACAKAEHVLVYCYQQRAAGIWWRRISRKLVGLDNLSVSGLPAGIGTRLENLARRNMALQCLVQDGNIWLSDEDTGIGFELERLL